ncbi:DUF861 domain containing protein [Nitzschia inconspicua]|uniref:DUF861 domain containing protein n=1 Tax=Nitzschia inconspicua TaxID=303405 RepID=A0A9K3LZW3_9STRA|nr:DUF861 domain containing protein [Nitzschia inconspicua]
MSSNNYLSSLSDDLNYAAPLKRFPTRSHSGAMILGNSLTTAENVTLVHAPLSYFAIDRLTSKGPRQNADVGAPHDASRSLQRDVGTSIPGNSIAAGSWWCAQGGWPSKKLRTTTEIFHVLQGFGCLTDLDGKRNFFGPSDTVILPKGWSGRWDVAEPIHKIWFVHDHEKIEEDTTQTIRARIIHYHDLTASHTMTPLKARNDATHNTSPQSTSKSIYDVGPTEVGYWTCTPGSFSVTKQSTECFHVLEGVFFLTNAADGTSQKCAAGDTILLPRGWSGDFDILETVKKVWIEV